MTDHYIEAERLLNEANHISNPEVAERYIAAATVHALLANARPNRNDTGLVFDDGNRRVYLTSGGTFVAAEFGLWLPGTYADLAAAMAAFDVDDTVLAEMRDQAADTALTFPAVRAQAVHAGRGQKAESR